MDGTRHTPRQRRRRAWVTMLVGVAVAGCGASRPDAPPGRVVVAVSAGSIERQPGMTAVLDDLLHAAAAGDEAMLDVIVDRPDGPSTVATIDLVPRRGTAVERSAERRRTLVDATVADVGGRLAAVAGDSGRIDVLGLLARVARAPEGTTGVVMTSGLQTSGPLAVSALGWDMVGSDAVLDQAVAHALLPDLTGRSVVFSGLGDVVAPQDRLPERLRSRLVAMWTGLCARAGARECRVDAEPDRGAGPVSTVPVPVTAVPPDPALVLPVSVGSGPAVTELPADVLFEPDSTRLLPGAVTLLTGAARSLPAGAAIGLVGRTATVGAAGSARAFSLERAARCKEALVAGGAPAERITVTGLGHDAPLVPDVDASGRLIPDAARRNRTVTMTITPGGTP